MKLIVVLTIIVFCGCNSNMQSGGAAGSGWIVPAVGDQFVYEDSNGVIQSAESDTSTTRQNLSFDTLSFLSAQSGVTYFSANVSPLHDLSSLRYLGDGDLANLQPVPFRLQWEIFPTGTHQTYTLLIDSTIETFHVYYVDTRTYVGNDSLTILGSSYSTIHVRSDVFEVMGSSTDTALITTDWWFALTLGVPAMIRQISQSFNGTQNHSSIDTTESALVRYRK